MKRNAEYSKIVTEYILKYFESKPQITVFFTDESPKNSSDTLSQMLEETGKVEKLTFVSQEDALIQYKEQNKNDPLLLEMVTADILPASLEVQAKDPMELPALESVIKTAKGVEEIVYQKDVVDALLSWTKIIRLSGLAVVVLFLLSAILTTMTVIGMKIAIKRDEIDILKLLGATSWYIRGPFLLEGMWYGGFGALMAWLLLTSLIVAFRSELMQFLGVVPTITQLLSDPTTPLFISSSLGFLGVLLTSGLLLGILGSFIALNRFLKL
jgi:cell division transport system permease protein